MQPCLNDRARQPPYDRTGTPDQPHQLLETAADVVGDEIDHPMLEDQHQLAGLAAEMGRRQLARGAPPSNAARSTIHWVTARRNAERS